MVLNGLGLRVLFLVLDGGTITDILRKAKMGLADFALIVILLLFSIVWAMKG